MSLKTDYEERCARQSDINQQMPKLYELAQQCDVVCEFGVRTGNSTAALLYGLQPGGTLHSFDINPTHFTPPLPSEGVTWHFHQCDTSAIDEIPWCNMLFIDTLHTSWQVERELKHAGKVKKWIAFHDTMLFGDKGESPGGGHGITHAIYSFLIENDENWRIVYHNPENCGLLVLERR